MDEKKLIKFLSTHAEIEFIAEEESCPVRGNALSSGDNDVDREEEDKIINRLNQGDIAAWFCAKVTARYMGFEGVDYLGCCSYASLEDFKSSDGYYPDMMEAAIKDLASAILGCEEKLKAIEALL